MTVYDVVSRVPLSVNFESHNNGTEEKNCNKPRRLKDEAEDNKKVEKKTRRTHKGYKSERDTHTQDRYTIRTGYTTNISRAKNVLGNHQHGTIKQSQGRTEGCMFVPVREGRGCRHGGIRAGMM